ncbi:MAG: thioredoxin-disulfide reductase [Chlamydiae bacterium]|nr:thioredoxin-disulfide reductase [Chlamydiota bacterium]MBI3276968.1 thioredoxin-disulfide reductase [Chlamydiota bacterium]
MSNDKVYKVLILGSGPAGLTAAIYAGRANLFPVVVEGTQPGGQLTITTDVENYPGFPDGIMGPELMVLFRKQAERFGTKYISGDIASIDLKQSPFTVHLENDEIKTQTLIISTGASAKLLEIPSEKKLMGHGVSACATCDGYFFRGKEVAVIGGGDTAMEEANFLARFCSKVTVIHRRDQLRASKIMQERALKNPKIDFIWNAVIEEFLGEPTTGLKGIRLKDIKGNKIFEKKFNGAFVAIGHEPNTRWFKGQLDLDEKGYIKTQTGSTATNVPGIFAAGDVQDHKYRQAVTAAGTGCMAAMDAERYLEALAGV